MGVVEHDVGLRDGRAEDGSVGGGGGWHREGGIENILPFVRVVWVWVCVVCVCLGCMGLDVCMHVRMQSPDGDFSGVFLCI